MCVIMLLNDDRIDKNLVWCLIWMFEDVKIFDLKVFFKGNLYFVCLLFYVM